MVNQISVVTRELTTQMVIKTLKVLLSCSGGTKNLNGIVLIDLKVGSKSELPGVFAMCPLCLKITDV